MKKVIVILLLFCAFVLQGQTVINVYCSTAGSDDSGNGTIGSPYRSIPAAFYSNGYYLNNATLNIVLLTAGDYGWGNNLNMFLSNFHMVNSSFNIVGTEQLYQEGFTLTKISGTRFMYKLKKIGTSWTLNELLGKFVKDGSNFYSIAYNSAGSDSITVDIVSPTCAGTQIYAMTCNINNAVGTNLFMDFQVQQSVNSFFSFQKCKITSSQGLIYNRCNVEFKPKWNNFNVGEMLIGDAFIYSTCIFNAVDNIITSTAISTALDIMKNDRTRLTRTAIVPVVLFSERPLAVTNTDNTTLYDLYIKSDINHAGIQVMKGATMRWGKCISIRDSKFAFDIKQEATIVEDTIVSDVTFLELINTKAVLEKFPDNTVNVQVNNMNLINCVDFRHFFDRSTTYVDFQRNISIYLPEY